METAGFKSPGHSAVVQMNLCLNGHVLSIAQMGPDFLVLQDPIDHPACDADIAMSIDGDASRWQVRLIDGIARSRQKTRIERIP